MEFYKYQISCQVLYILDVFKKDRYFINKHFQNSIVNYFLEDCAGKLLKKILNFKTLKCVQSYIFRKYSQFKGPKYMKLLDGYIKEVKCLNLENELKNILVEQFTAQSEIDQTNKIWQTSVWKRAFSLFVYHYIDNSELKCIFSIWNSLFPSTPIIRKRKANNKHAFNSLKSFSEISKLSQQETQDNFSLNQINNSELDFFQQVPEEQIINNHIFEEENQAQPNYNYFSCFQNQVITVNSHQN